MAQTYFSDDFSDLDISDWTQYDVDGDTYIWTVGDWSAVGDNPIAEFDHTMVSRSWIGGAGGPGGLNPNNYTVSPAIDLTGAPAAGLVLEYAYGTIQDPPYHTETYSVYITTANDLATLQAATAVHTETLSVPESRETNSIDLSSYAGQTIYVTFRHHDTFDMNTMMIDDVVVRIPVDSDALLESVSLNRYSMPSVDNTLSMTIENNGSNAISSVEVNWNDGTTDHISTINVAIAPGASATVDHPTPVNYSSVGEQNITVTVTAVDGAADGDPSNNVQNVTFNTLSQAGTKAVLIEESTGTWCGWCPRGTVGLDYMTTTYPNTVVGIAVHNDDPMEVVDYDAGLVATIGGGWPNSGLDRKLNGVDPGQSTLQNGYNTQITETVPLDLTANATIAGNNLTITAEANFYTSFSAANFRLGVIITEDAVTGTSSGYNQVNYYAGGGNGAMGGYESLPDPVPAAQMTYNHVGRALLGGFDGQANSVPATITNGQVVQQNFNYTIPASSNQDNMYIVVVLIDGVDGSIVNAMQRSVNDALSTNNFELASAVKIHPNPANDRFNVSFEASNANYNITVTDMLGRTVLTENHKDLSGNQNIEISTDQFSTGQYIVTIATGNASYSKRLVVNK
jgi:hypothetical protein